MKKIYMNPTTTVVNIQTIVMNTGSISVGIDGSANSAESRGSFGIWGDELDEDF